MESAPTCWTAHGSRYPASLQVPIVSVLKTLPRITMGWLPKFMVLHVAIFIKEIGMLILIQKSSLLNHAQVLYFLVLVSACANGLCIAKYLEGEFFCMEIPVLEGKQCHSCRNINSNIHHPWLTYSCLQLKKLLWSSSLAAKTASHITCCQW